MLKRRPNDNEQQQQIPSTLVNLKRVKVEKDAKGRDRTVITFGTDKDGNNGLDVLLEALNALQGKQANLDIRIEEKTSERGAKFMTGFVLVREMVPKDAPKKAYTPSSSSKTSQLKARAQAVRQAVEE